jgi:hypothetical protein
LDALLIEPSKDDRVRDLQISIADPIVEESVNAIGGPTEHAGDLARE